MPSNNLSRDQLKLSKLNVTQWGLTARSFECLCPQLGSLCFVRSAVKAQSQHGRAVKQQDVLQEVLQEGEPAQAGAEFLQDYSTH
eukprot:1701136-Amphidinium_carterae.1